MEVDPVSGEVIGFEDENDRLGALDGRRLERGSDDTAGAAARSPMPNVSGLGKSFLDRRSLTQAEVDTMKANMSSLHDLETERLKGIRESRFSSVLVDGTGELHLENVLFDEPSDGEHVSASNESFPRDLQFSEPRDSTALVYDVNADAIKNVYSDSETEGNQQDDQDDLNYESASRSDSSKYQGNFERNQASSMFERRNMVDEAASFLMRSNQDVSRGQSSGPVAKSLFKVLKEQDDATRTRSRDQTLIDASLSDTCLGSLNGAQSDSKNDVPQETFKEQAAREAARLKLRESILGIVKRENINFPGYCFDDVEDAGVSGIRFRTACLEGDVKYVDSLLGSLTSPDIEQLIAWKDHLGQTTLHRLAQLRKTQFKESTHSKIIGWLLLHSSANLDDRDALGWSPLFYAVQSENEKMLGQLLEFGASLYLHDNQAAPLSELDQQEKPDGKTPSGTGRDRSEKLVNELQKGTEELDTPRTPMDWCMLGTSESTLQFIQKFTFVRLESPLRFVQGVSPLIEPFEQATKRVWVRWNSMCALHEFDVFFHVIETLGAAKAEVLAARAPHLASLPQGDDSEEGGPFRADADQVEPVSLAEACDFVTRKILSGGYKLRTGQKVESLQRSRTSQLEERKPSSSNSQGRESAAASGMAWANDSHVFQDRIVKDALFTLQIAQRVQNNKFLWAPSIELAKHIPHDGLALFRVVHSRNKAIVGFSEVFPALAT